MQELLDKAQEISGVKFDISSYADIVKAIHVVQQEMGISGTTAKEAAGTIAGSAGSIKAAWDNLVAGLARPDADLGRLIDDVIQSGKTALKNLIPTIRQALTGLARLIKEIAPVIADELPGLINDILPPLIEAATTLIVALVQNLPTILTVLFDALPGVMDAVGSALMESWPAISDALLGALNTTSGRIIAIIGGLVVGLKAFKIGKTVVDLFSTISGVTGKIPGLVSSMATSVQGSAGILSTALGTVATAALGMADALLVTYDVQKLSEAAETYNEANDAYLNEINTAFENYAKLYNEKGKEVADQWAQMVYQIDTSNLSLEESQKAIAEKINTYWDDVPRNMWDGFKSGWNSYFGEGGSGLFGLMGDAFSGALNGIRGMLGIASPSKVFAEIGKFVDEGYAKGVLENLDTVEDAMDDFAGTIYNDNLYRDQEIQTVSTSIIGDNDNRFKGTSGDSKEQEITLIIELDGDVLARKMYRHNQDEAVRRGNSFVNA